MELKQFLKLSVTTLLLLSISGCSFLKREPPEVIVKSVEVKVPIQHPTPPRPVEMTDVYWYVVSPKNLEEFLERIEKEGNGVFFAMTVKDYENLSYNIQEVRRWINQTKEILIYYRNVDKKSDESSITSVKEETNSQ